MNAPWRILRVALVALLVGSLGLGFVGWRHLQWLPARRATASRSQVISVATFTKLPTAWAADASTDDDGASKSQACLSISPGVDPTESASALRLASAAPFPAAADSLQKRHVRIQV